MMQSIGRMMASYLSRSNPKNQSVETSSLVSVLPTLKRADVLLVEGNSKISQGIKYLTQSTWSHAALYIGEALLPESEGIPTAALIEADVHDGVRLVPVSRYASFHTRICRPVGLSDDDIDRVIAHAMQHLGHQYDLKNIIDLVRYLLPTPPVPQHWRRRMIALGSGDPTRAICSSLIAKAFQHVHYPILPDIEHIDRQEPGCIRCRDEILHIRHHSLFTPRDFDVSPFFQIIKPRIAAGFDPYRVTWSREPLAPPLE
ncbi:MAG: YiiX/YebB-like N1pC/P60 family cysteine hydrolase [Saccharospirillum sp.]|uniref:YiiX/YebB-like N1pC/P60 family cysteine hydrolase n=1 Tax=Saccharospirillum sp. TaxID=2033801 RepID=UPI003298FBBD